MTAKEKQTLLEQYRALRQETDYFVEKLEYVKSLRASLPARRDERTGKGYKGSRTEQIALKIVELERLYLTKRGEALELRVRIETAIAAIPDATQRQLLRLRYIDGLVNWKVAEQLNYSEVHVYRLHKKALEALEL